MTIRHGPKIGSTTASFGLSLLVHMIAGLIISVQTLPPPAPIMKRPAPSAPIPLISEEELKRLRSLKTPKAKAIEKEKRERQATKPKQVVEIPPPPIEEIPTESRFLAEFNSAVKREMIHRERRAPQAAMRASDKRSLSSGHDLNGSRRGKRHLISQEKAKDSKRPKPVKQAPKRGEQKRSPNQESPRQKEKSKSTKLKPGEGQFNPQDKDLPTSSDQAYGARTRKRDGKGAEPLTPTHYQSLLPSLGPQDLARIDGSLDHVTEVQKGDQTALNTKEFRYAFFFNRVKREVSARWNPAGELGRADPRGQVYGVRDRSTVLSIALKPDGTISKIDVTQASGIPLLDREAVSAFLRAQPFHNPPKGLIEEDGLIRFKFGFYLEIGSRSFKLFR